MQKKFKYDIITKVKVLIRSFKSMNYIIALGDILFTIFLAYSFFGIYVTSKTQLIYIILAITGITFITMFAKQVYSKHELAPKIYYSLFESLAVATGIICLLIFWRNCR